MKKGRASRPDFSTASDQEIAEYYRACMMWGDEKGIEDADRELRRRGKDKQADYLHNQLP